MLGGCASKGLCCGIFGGGGRKEGGPRRQRLEIWTANGKDFPEGLEHLRTVKS